MPRNEDSEIEPEQPARQLGREEARKHSDEPKTSVDRAAKRQTTRPSNNGNRERILQSTLSPGAGMKNRRETAAKSRESSPRKRCDSGEALQRNSPEKTAGGGVGGGDRDGWAEGERRELELAGRSWRERGRVYGEREERGSCVGEYGTSAVAIGSAHVFLRLLQISLGSPTPFPT
ncbi:hypothetical protein NL676_017923 [Syzygium grande]|nr:hypothetical protein NL676_017923 [Syzygium grande]